MASKLKIKKLSFFKSKVQWYRYTGEYDTTLLVGKSGKKKNTFDTGKTGHHIGSKFIKLRDDVDFSGFAGWVDADGVGIIIKKFGQADFGEIVKLFGGKCTTSSFIYKSSGCGQGTLYQAQFKDNMGGYVVATLIDKAMRQIIGKNKKKLNKREKEFIAHFRKDSVFGAKWSGYLNKYNSQSEGASQTQSKFKLGPREAFVEAIRKKINEYASNTDLVGGDDSDFAWVTYNDKTATLYKVINSAGATIAEPLEWKGADPKHKNFFVGFEFSKSGKNSDYNKKITQTNTAPAFDKLDLPSFKKFTQLYLNPNVERNWAWFEEYFPDFSPEQKAALKTPAFSKEFGTAPAGWTPNWSDYQARLNKAVKMKDAYTEANLKGQKAVDALPAEFKHPPLKKAQKLVKTDYDTYAGGLVNAVALAEAILLKRFTQSLFVYTKWSETESAVGAGKTFAETDAEAEAKNDFAKANKSNLNKTTNNLKTAQDNLPPAVTTSAVTDAEDLSKEELEKRQRLKLQCALMMNMVEVKNPLKDGYLGAANSNNNHNDIHLADVIGPNKNEIINILMGTPYNSARPFLQITPDIASALSPKVRLFKVNDEKGGVSETEFVFDTFVGQNKNRMMALDDIDRGDGMGLKEFSFSFNGTTPATARKDIKAKLVMYFQSFQDFLKSRKNIKGQSYKFVDLLIRPLGKDANRGFGGSGASQYDPSYYRIRVDVGWNVREDDGFKQILTRRKLSGLTNNEGEIEAVDVKGFSNSIKNINKTYYLNMIEHSINVRKDGSIEVTAEYQAYMESLAKSHPLDALSNAELLNQRMDMNKDLEKIRVGCSNDQTKIAMNLFSIKEELLLEKAYRSIMERLLERGAVLKKFIDTTTTKTNPKTGLFEKTPDLLSFDKVKKHFQDSSKDKNQKPQAAATLAVSGVKSHGKVCDVFQILPPASPVLQLNYFYLGDLIDVVLDCKKGIKKQKRPELEKFKIILGSFFYKGKSINIAQVPISTHYFFEWMTNHVISKKIKTFPLMKFIRTITNHLVVDIMTDKCSGDKFPNGIQFRTTTGIGPSKPRSGFPGSGRSVSNIKLPDSGKPYLNAAIDDGKSSNNLNHYIIVYAMTGNRHPKKTRTGNKKLDMKDGIYHLHVGQNRGIVKSVSFDKTDIQYVREANFFRNGIDGLSQIGAVYNVTVDMIGNTLFYPGMQIYLNPLGIGGIEFDPRRRGAARTLGFGGYHIITKVTNKITPTGFNTSVVAMWDYSGGTGGDEKVESKLSEQSVANLSSDNYCATDGILRKLQRDVGRLINESAGSPKKKKK